MPNAHPPSLSDPCEPHVLCLRTRTEGKLTAPQMPASGASLSSQQASYHIQKYTGILVTTTKLAHAWHV